MKTRYKDLTNYKFSRFVVVKFHHIGKHYQRFYECVCSCGNKRILYSGDIVGNRYKSCGCLKVDSPHYTLPIGEYGFKRLYNNYAKNCSVKRNIFFNLSKKLFRTLTKNNCFYCGRKPNQIIGKTRNKKVHDRSIYVYNGIDRINNFNGYTKTNVVTCCKTCNKMKDVLSQKSFFTHIKKILNKKDSKRIDQKLNVYQGGFKSLFRIYKYNANLRKLNFTITQKHFKKLTRNNCYYCGTPPHSFIKCRNGNSYQYNGIDRIKSSKGYIKNNVVSCCSTCNKFKSDINIKNFILHLKKIEKQCLK